MKIMIDAGHGLNTPGKRSVDGMREYAFNREVANHCKEYLAEYHNVTSYFSHSDKFDVSLQGRVDAANKMNVDLFVSIHANAYGKGDDWTEPHGIETFIHTSKPTIALGLANKVQAMLVENTHRNNRGVKTADFYVLKHTDMPAILVECGFMTNKGEAALLKTNSYRKLCAYSIVQAIVAYYNLKIKVVIPKPEVNEDKLYRVQVGAFVNRSGAEALQKELNKKGFKSFISY